MVGLAPGIQRKFFAECCQAFSPEARPHRIRCGLPEFPMDLVLVPSENDKQLLEEMQAGSTNAQTVMQEILSHRSLLVLGAGLGGGAVTLPDRYYPPYVVLILRPQGHYGFRKVRYIKGDESTWQGDTAAAPCVLFWNICSVLHLMGMQPLMRCLGTSAGVDSIPSVVATQTDEEIKRFDILCFVAIAGAWHPEL